MVGEAGLEGLLDADGVLDEDEVGYALVDFEAGEGAQFLIEELAVPFHVVGYLAVVVLAVEGGEGYGFAEAVVAEVFVGVVEEAFVSLAYEAEAHAEAGEAEELGEGARDDEVGVLLYEWGDVCRVVGDE